MGLGQLLATWESQRLTVKVCILSFFHVVTGLDHYSLCLSACIPPDTIQYLPLDVELDTTLE